MHLHLSSRKASVTHGFGNHKNANGFIFFIFFFFFSVVWTGWYCKAGPLKKSEKEKEEMQQLMGN